MQIDWLTVGAQIVNFLVLVALLRRFLYRPVLDAMDRREQRIAERLHEAERREAQASARAQEFQEKSDDLDRRRKELLVQARDEAEAERHDRLQDARAEVERQRERWHTQLEQEWDEVRKSLIRRLSGAVTDASRRALADLADTTLEQAIARTFCRRLAGLDESDRHAIAGEAGALELATTFDPDDEVRATLSEAVQEHLGRDVRFVRASDLTGGIELRAHGWKVSWTIDEYLREFEERLAETIAGASHHVGR
ncbi:MAG: F0F1 ATP synthase subunit B [Vicinamibacterales bacterium]